MLDSFKQWFAQPFSADMDAWHWALFVLLLIVIMVAWGRALSVTREITS